ncbi:disease resistance protein, partial [Striga asiatica]
MNGEAFEAVDRFLIAAPSLKKNFEAPIAPYRIFCEEQLLENRNRAFLLILWALLGVDGRSSVVLVGESYLEPLISYVENKNTGYPFSGRTHVRLSSLVLLTGV